jgi:hypothetical protein
MKYKTFRINVFEPEPGKWRARITRWHRGRACGGPSGFAIFYSAVTVLAQTHSAS